jgi:hypothetical protein
MRRREAMTTQTVRFVPVAALVAALALAMPAGASDFPGFCRASADALLQGCYAHFIGDRFIRKAICFNVTDDKERAECQADREEQRQEDKELCNEQHLTRVRACRLLGEARYDPDFEPELFDDPRSPSKPNSFYPLNVGYKWEYLGGGEVNTVEVLNETKLLEGGVRCIVVKDRVEVGGFTTELTNDWFATAKDGTTWYCGEETGEFETFDGDDPKKEELVDIDGSFKAGRDGDKPGIIFLAAPKVGDVYLEEFSLGNAEDVTEILSTTYKFGDDAKLDHLVPQALADRFCNGDCVMTKNYSLLEPGAFAHKLYAPGIGVIAEVEFGEDEESVHQLTSCSFDPRCENLPQP